MPHMTDMDGQPSKGMWIFIAAVIAVVMGVAAANAMKAKQAETPAPTPSISAS